ncbi:hypothetical protein FDG2_1650 [Candidatus Protofrankia californiensis]|uniref:DUF58 domain-containing protein n=1 Tax=Candidatus Protofrankia californiensis TaxID=1839754 RepID=A0A1C3NW43_9ACTN|nr:hypothetical protein FDG2_1650 [Candidatus Protofrankia californiensis]
MAITGRAAGFALAGVFAVLLSPAPGATLLLVNAALVLALVADVVLAGGVRTLAFTRSGPTRSRLGEPVPLVLAVTNTGRRRVRALVRDAWPPSSGAEPRVLHVTVPAGQRRFCEIVLHPTRRGERHPYRITVRSLGPLGLAGRQGRHHAPFQVRVLPAFTSRRHIPAAFARLQKIEGNVTLRIGGQGSEFDSLRDYVPGDDVRMIDWRASARRGTVAVRSFRPERDRRVICVLDTGRTSAGRIGDTPRLDHAMDAALLLATVAARAGDRIGLLAHDTTARITLPAAGGGDPVVRISAAMALVEPVLAEADHHAIVSSVLRTAGRHCLVVLFTELAPAVIEEGLLPALPALTARHTVVVAAVSDPRLTELAAGRGDVRAVYSAAAAGQALLRRRQLAGLLRQRGAQVVDAPPSTYAAAVTDVYLTLKSTGGL